MFKAQLEKLSVQNGPYLKVNRVDEINRYY
jgi:hypothetical protein